MPNEQIQASPSGLVTFFQPLFEYYLNIELNTLVAVNWLKLTLKLTEPTGPTDK